MPLVAQAALAGVDYAATPGKPSAQGGLTAPSASEIAAATQGSGGSAASSSTGTPTQKSNTSSVSHILHPAPKDAKKVKFPEPMEVEDLDTKIMDNSILAYPGRCPCPYSENADGYECGVEAAYYKPGGFRIYCYPEDVRGQLHIFYRKTH